MPEKTNYLLGYGERLTEQIVASKGGGEKTHPYTFSEARTRLTPRVTEVSLSLDTLPPAACPRDEAVAAITLHPTYLAKSYFPSELFNAVGLDVVGSKPKIVRPEKWAPKKKQKEAVSTELFVAGQRRRFREWATELPRWDESHRGSDDLFKIEDFRFVTAEERVKPILSNDTNPLLEIVLHVPQGQDWILEGFERYLRSFDIRPDLNRRISVEGLCFLPLRIRRNVINEVAKFSFLRVAREMPRLRQFPSLMREAPPRTEDKVELPQGNPLDPNLRVAVFDGGLPKDHPLSHWATCHTTDNLEEPIEEGEKHGLGVTSALLFGSLNHGKPLRSPSAFVDHFRVLDKKSLNDPQEDYFDVLERISAILESRRYQFVNFSIGPDLPIEDDDVHVWTAKLDQLFSDGETLATSAVGNSGEADRDSGNARIQAPSDGVNLLGVGAADSQGDEWARAEYSSVGPGRSPGIVKPDVVTFGGARDNPFWVLAATNDQAIVPTAGTSFAAPNALRLALGVRAHLGPTIGPLALRALLLHHAQPSVHHKHDVGWGRVSENIEDLIICEAGTVHVVYQGLLDPAKYLRAQIPMPDGTLQGKIEISATFCYATETDPKDPINYTRAGLEVIYRPHRLKRTKASQLHADSKPFFQSAERGLPESKLRADAFKWETTLKMTKIFQSTSLHDPVFDIHYNARLGGAPTLSAQPIRYALVVSVRSKSMLDIYDRIVARYRTQLQPLVPVIQIPVRT